MSSNFNEVQCKGLGTACGTCSKCAADTGTPATPVISVEDSLRFQLAHAEEKAESLLQEILDFQAKVKEQTGQLIPTPSSLVPSISFNEVFKNRSVPDQL